MNLTMIPTAFDVLRKGSALADPDLWRSRGEALKVAIVAFVLSLNPLAKALGYDFQLDAATAGAIGLVAVWLVGLFIHHAASPAAGVLPPKPAPADPAASDLRDGP